MAKKRLVYSPTQSRSGKNKGINPSIYNISTPEKAPSLRKKGDPHRHKTRCKNYLKGANKCTLVEDNLKICNGSRECLFYEESLKKDTLTQSKRKQTKNNIVQRPMQEFYHATNNRHISLTKAFGTPAHVTYLKKQDWDERRNKTRCIYYNQPDKTCMTTKMHYYGLRCPGSAHCTAYVERPQTPQPKKSNKRAINAPKTPNVIKPLVSKHDQKIPFDHVNYRDKVTLYCYTDKENLSFVMKCASDKLPPLHDACLDKPRGYKFSLNGYEYVIVSFKKHRSDKEV